MNHAVPERPRFEPDPAFTPPWQPADRIRARQVSPVELVDLCLQTGHPAVSVPNGLSPGGLPIGFPVVGRFGGEGSVFRVAVAFEAARPWADRRSVEGSDRIEMCQFDNNNTDIHRY